MSLIFFQTFENARDFDNLAKSKSFVNIENEWNYPVHSLSSDISSVEVSFLLKNQYIVDHNRDSCLGFEDMNSEISSSRKCS